MNSKIISNGILRAIISLALFVIIIWFLYQISSVIVYIIIAAIVTLISKPILAFFKKRLKFKNTLAVIATLAIYIIVLSLFFTLFAPLVSKQSKNIALLNSDEFLDKVNQISQQINTYLLKYNINFFEKLRSFDIASQFKNLPDAVNIIIGKLGSFSIAILSVLFISFFFMYDGKLLARSFYTIVPKKHIYKVARSIDSIQDLLSRYFIGLILQIGLLFIIYTIILSVFDIESAFVIALVCASLNLIPYLGPLIGAVLMFVLVATDNLDLNFQTEILPRTLYIMIGYFAAQMLDNFISQPLIYSKSVKSHPLEIFLVILIFGSLLGVLGMVISIPCYTVIKVILKEFFGNNKVVNSLTKNI